MTAQTSLGKFCIIASYTHIYFIDLKCSCTVKIYIRTEACVTLYSMDVRFRVYFCIFRHPVVCGVSSLGLDHQSLLGATIDKIAWQKGGIFKVIVTIAIYTMFVRENLTS